MGLLVVSVVALLAVLAVRAHADAHGEEPFERDLTADEHDLLGTAVVRDRQAADERDLQTADMRDRQAAAERDPPGTAGERHRLRTADVHHLLGTADVRHLLGTADERHRLRTAGVRHLLGTADERDPPGTADERDAWHHARREVAGDVPPEVAVEVRGAPPIDAVVAAAYRAAGLADDPIGSWRLRSRLSALLPSISVRVGQNDHWRDVIDPTVSRGVTFDVRAAWQIDRLLFDSHEPRFEMIDVARRRERRRLGTLVVHRYFDWLAARGAAAVLDAAEHAAELDALTDGWFSQAAGKAAQP